MKVGGSVRDVRELIAVGRALPAHPAADRPRAQRSAVRGRGHGRAPPRAHAVPGVLGSPAADRARGCRRRLAREDELARRRRGRARGRRQRDRRDGPVREPGRGAARRARLSVEGVRGSPDEHGSARAGPDRTASARATRPGAVLQRIDTGMGATAPPCEARKRGCPSRAQRRGRWSDARDPIAAKQAPFITRRGRDARASGSRSAHPAVAQIVAGQPFSFDGVALWSKCGGGLIGGVVPIRLSRPITFEGDVPLHGYRNGSAYLEGVWHIRVQNAIAFRVYVDLGRKRVVGISPDSDTPGRTRGRTAGHDGGLHDRRTTAPGRQGLRRLRGEAGGVARRS